MIPYNMEVLHSASRGHCLLMSSRLVKCINNVNCSYTFHVISYVEHPMGMFVSSGNSWRRGGEEKREERDRERPREREREPDTDGEKGWRGDKEKPGRTKNETDDDGWTTVRR